MSSSKPANTLPTRDQRRRAAWLAVTLQEALQDGASPSWKAIDRAYGRAHGFEYKGEQVLIALFVVVETRLETESDPVDRVRRMLERLAVADPAFATLTLERAVDICDRKVIAWNTLARLAHACGALGCEQSDDSPKYEYFVKRTITLWQNATDKPALSLDQQMQANWLEAMLRAAKADCAHPAWGIIRSAWMLARGRANVKSKLYRQVEECFRHLTDFAAGVAMASAEGVTYEPSGTVSLLLGEIDPAFYRLDVRQIDRVLRSNEFDLSPREKRGGNGKAGPAAVLARLTLQCGALECPICERPDQDAVNLEADRLRKLYERAKRDPELRAAREREEEESRALYENRRGKHNASG